MGITRLCAFIRFIALVLLSTLMPVSLHAQEAPADKPFSTEQLDQMLAPMALYPDDVLSNVLMASTYPLEVVQAARWRKEPANAKLKGDALTKALEAKEWDPSVKSLTAVADVLQTLSDKLEWTQKLGDAFIAQEDEVFARIQYLRQKADEAGNLKTTQQQKVTKQTNYIVIEQAQPEVVYVPVYQPTVVYGTWWYPSYPPYYWYWGRPTSSFVNGFFWGAGYAVSRSLWGWGRCDWGRNDIHIDVDRYNSINVNRTQINSNTWNHDAKHRGSVPYRDQASREKHGKVAKTKDLREDFRGYDKGNVKDKLGESGAGKVKDKVGDGGAAKVKEKLGDGGAASKVKDKVGDGGAAKVKDKVGDGGGAKIKDKAVSAKPKAVSNKIATTEIKSKPAAKALDVRPKATVQRQADRGAVSRKSAMSKPAGMGGGGKRAGGGGNRGGGRRR